MEQKRIVGTIKDSPKSRDARRVSTLILTSSLKLANEVKHSAPPKSSELTRPVTVRGQA